MDAKNSVGTPHLQDWVSTVLEQMQAAVSGYAQSQHCNTSSKLVVSIDSLSGCYNAGLLEGSHTWPCGLAYAHLENAGSQSTDHQVDELLRGHAHNWNNSQGQDHAGKYTIIVVDGGHNGKYFNHLWLIVNVTSAVWMQAYDNDRKASLLMNSSGVYS